MAEQYNSNFTGPEIDAILGNAVRYDLAQSLTAAQQAQARGNIAAAPSGYGLGEARAHEVISDCDEATLSGLYIMSSNTANWPTNIDDVKYSLLRVSARTPTEILQEVFAIGVSGRYDFSAVRSYGSSTGWAPWEYVNPALKLGVEYRTTERYLGKPVYVKVLNFGALPNATRKAISTGFTDNQIMPLRVSGHFWVGADRHSLPYNHSDTDRANILNFNGASVTIETVKNYSAFTCYVEIAYTKDTD